METLTLEQKEFIQSKPTKTSKSIGLLDIIEQQPAIYWCLLDVLDVTEQGHVIKILQGGMPCEKKIMMNFSLK